MSALEIITVLIILGIATQIYLNSNKNSEQESPKPAKPEEQAAHTDQPNIPEVIKSTENPQRPVIETTTPPTHPTAAQSNSDLLETTGLENLTHLPQDSILKRHYLTHLCSMIESLASERPTDSVLSRHHDAMLAARLLECSIDQNATEQLHQDYEKRNPLADVEALVIMPQEKLVEVSCAETNINPLPQDSVLKRHYLTHITSMIEALASPCPTDSVLYRHHDALIANKLTECLSDQASMQQLFSDYESQK